MGVAELTWIFQSVIESPERVKRVKPPTVTIPATKVPVPRSQKARGLVDSRRVTASPTRGTALGRLVATVDRVRLRQLVLLAAQARSVACPTTLGRSRHTKALLGPIRMPPVVGIRGQRLSAEQLSQGLPLCG